MPHSSKETVSFSSKTVSKIRNTFNSKSSDSDSENKIMVQSSRKDGKLKQLVQKELRKLGLQSDSNDTSSDSSSSDGSSSSDSSDDESFKKSAKMKKHKKKEKRKMRSNDTSSDSSSSGESSSSDSSDDDFVQKSDKKKHRRRRRRGNLGLVPNLQTR